MLQQIYFKIYSNLLLTFLLLSPTLSFRFEDDYDIRHCVEYMANSTQCECSTVNYDHLYQCPTMEPVAQIEMKIIPNRKNHVNVEIVCNHNEYESLPAMKIGVAYLLHMVHCPFPNASISHTIYNQLGISDLALLTFFNSTSNFTHKHLSGLRNVGILTFNATDLTQMPEDIFTDLPKLNSLYLLSSNVRLTANTFAALENLRVLILSDNKLQQLPVGIFRNQRKLGVLKMDNNQLHNISRDFFSDITTIKLLDLSSNGIETLKADDFSLLTNLENIELSSNHIEELPTKLFSENKQLLTVRVSNNSRPLKAMASFANLRDLETVDVTCNATLTDDMQFLDNSRLVLTMQSRGFHKKTFRINCGLREIPADLLANTSMFTEISLARNALTTLPAKLFAGQEHLLKLDLSHNRLQTLPYGLFKPTFYMLALRLSHNQLTEISSEIFYYFHYLERLYLDNNHLLTIDPKAFMRCAQLRFLNLENNRISIGYEQIEFYPFSGLITPFRFLKKLQTLNLRNNSVSTIFSDWWDEMSELKEVDLSHNLIPLLDPNDLYQLRNVGFSIDLSYNRIRKIIYQFWPTSSFGSDPTTSFATLQLSNNPLICDCDLLPFIQYVRGELPNAAPLNLILDQLVCAKPDKMRGLYVRNVDPNAILCPFNFKRIAPTVHCPNGCKCWKRIHDPVLIVNCSSSNLTVVPELPLLQPLALKHLELHVENNRLRKLPKVINATTGYSDVTQIYAAGNNISQIDIDNLPVHLAQLDLSRNTLKELDENVLSFFKQSSTLKKIGLSENPWNCECKNKPLLQFIKEANTKLTDIDEIYCASPVKGKMIISDICQNDQALTLGILFCCLAITLIAALYYKYQTEVKIYMYKYHLFSCCVNEIELDKDKRYDAFISYSHKDEKFIAEHLVPELEVRGPICFKLCVHVRDFIVGECIPDQIIRAIDESRRTIVVLSKNFIESVWARMEFRLAHQAALNEKRSRVIVIIYDEIGDVELLDPDLKAYLKMTTYLKWGDQWFWDKLRYAMPHRSKKVANFDIPLQVRCSEIEKSESNGISTL